MTSVFTRIISGELPAHFVHRDERVVAFMSINPIAPGHVLVVPVAEVDEWTDLDAVTARELFEVSRRIGRVLRDLFPCERVGLIVAGYEVPHCHIHVVPTRSMADLSFANAAASVDGDRLRREAAAISGALVARPTE